jgi:type VI secretion system secreted protein VgrG
VPLDRLVGRPVTVTLLGRHFNGIVSRIGQGARDATGTRFHAEVVPQLWLLTRTAGSRVFQQLAVPEILRRVLGDAQVPSSFELERSYPARDYCVQYRESAFAFVSRLMEEEGIFYFFRHDAGGHTLVLGDGAGAYGDAGAFRFDRSGGSVQPRVLAWEKAQELRTGKVTVRDFDFELPESPIESSFAVAGGRAGLEQYDFPGYYAQRFDGVDPGGGDRRGDLAHLQEAADRTAHDRAEEEAAQIVVAEGVSTVPVLASGSTFALQGHFDADGRYLLTGVQHSATQPLQGTGGFEYTNSFTCIPASIPFRPPRAAPRPVLAGPQTAFVVGRPGAAPLVDKYGRVKVQFHWDREGKRDENSSCWIRVSQPVGGAGGGGLFWLPEVGDEVIVAFLEGDPDQPIIVGHVYNARERPPR